jgi:hypothetical protein
MGEIVDLAARRSRHQRTTAPRGPAQVVLFLGVRYERASDTPELSSGDKPAPKNRRKRRRVS